MSRAMTAWADDIVWFTDGRSRVSRGDERALLRNGVAVRRERIRRLEGAGGRLRAVVLESGEAVPREALFFDTESFQQSSLAARLGCSFDKSGGVRCGKYEATDVPGVFVAGNIIKDVHLAIVAAAEGARAAMGINKALTREDFERRDTGEPRLIHPDPEGALKRA
jgi:thioredoxin reductase